MTVLIGSGSTTTVQRVRLKEKQLFVELINDYLFRENKGVGLQITAVKLNL